MHGGGCIRVVIIVIVVVMCGGGDDVWVTWQHVWSFEAQMLRWPGIAYDYTICTLMLKKQKQLLQLTF